MKIEYNIKYKSSKLDIEKWLKDNEPVINPQRAKRFQNIYEHYFEVVDDFRVFLNSTETITDCNDQLLTPLHIYNAINYYKIRIEKLLLLFKLRLYKTYNVNKDTKVRYIVMRAFWIDDNGKPFRHFSKNLGAENKVLVNGQIPKPILDSVEVYIESLMWDLYYYEYLDDSIAGWDTEGNLVIPYED